MIKRLFLLVTRMWHAFPVALVGGGNARGASDANVGVRIFLFQANSSFGRVPACREIFASREREGRRAHDRLDGKLADFRRALDVGAIRSAAPADAGSE